MLGGAQPSQNSFLGGMMQGYNNYGAPQVGVGMPANQMPQAGYIAPAWQNPDAQKAAQISSQSSFKPQQYLG